MAKRFQVLMVAITNVKVDQLSLVEVLASLLVDLIGRVRLGDERQRLGPSQRCAFAVGKERRFPPGVESTEPLFGFAIGTGVLGMHVDAIGAAVDLGGAHPDQLDQGAFEPACRDVFLQAVDSLRRSGAALMYSSLGSMSTFRLMK